MSCRKKTTSHPYDIGLTPRLYYVCESRTKLKAVRLIHKRMQENGPCNEPVCPSFVKLLSEVLCQLK